MRIDRNIFLAVLAVFAGLAGLGAPGMAQDASDRNGPSGGGVNNPLIAAVAWKQTAAEYKALYYQAYNVARMNLDVALKERKPTDKPLAVISDIDDTIVNASNYWGYLINHNKDFFDDAVWDKWVAENKFTAQPGSIEFFRYAQSQGVEVFFVSSRVSAQPAPGCR